MLHPVASLQTGASLRCALQCCTHAIPFQRAQQASTVARYLCMVCSLSMPRQCTSCPSHCHRIYTTYCSILCPRLRSFYRCAGRRVAAERECERCRPALALQVVQAVVQGRVRPPARP